MPDHPEPRPSKPTKAAIKVASDLLSRKKPPFGQPSALARLPKFPRPLDAALSRLQKSPDLRAKLDPPSALVDPPPVNLPGGGPPVPAPEDGTPPGESTPPSPPIEATSAPSVMVDPVESIPSKEIAPTIASPSSIASLTLAGDAPVGQSSEIAPTPTGVVGSPGPVEAVANLASPLAKVPNLIADRVSFPGQIPSGMTGPLDGSPGPASTQGESLEPPRDIRIGNVAHVVDLGGTPSPVLGGDAGSVLPNGLRRDSASISVRNPLSSGLRNLSAALPESPGEGPIPGPDLAGGGSIPGFATDPHQSGGAVDLSKTNDLLRQILDAVHRQRDTSLPVGGQSVYPGR